MVQQVTTDEQRGAVEQFLARFDLDYEPEHDDLLGVWDAGGQLVACGARQQALLKMIAIDPAEQDSPMFGQLVGTLVKKGFEAGVETFFVVTRPQHTLSFEAVNFRLLCLTDQVALLEYGPGLSAYIERHHNVRHHGNNGAVVVNANPFTLGHRYLIETAAQQVDRLYVFVVEEESSSFPFAVRYDLVCQGVADLDNVEVLPSGPYAVSAITFPGYFLRDSALVEAQQHQLDAVLFARQLAPRFTICRRFIGSEPYCAVTRRYNEALKKILPTLGIDVVEVPRATTNGGAISASTVRELLQQRAINTLEKLVPSTTLNYLESAAFNGLSPVAGRH
ncbi:[citrate (pro-3S)-lyase] ligase [Desulfuromonas acetoxidans]|uniref:[Citrate [pro-3S]-lyase] ligase n=1 Tax=Desulfuromonas acetoxidans (strain DSM 684 / 11070) TaxID=281689 RepID=Q1JZB8_DESA6|nr:[citrate (pro-3S)-lyase] ligase [Desulfuromonas acetoxidans]EAT15649.1 Citrate lyase ligase [Desulfuromonas acetoxidans DSM 684]MBF0646614.1 [citrate (pro-3S)-lyase] ligase [Desulfuromonas acetoxidans]NVD25378.1 [citrate (pro-3S)-lyase] ligase [Desulfuromonas acetoxidans]NVE17430.1 [citrate (pro-3S)-lyase] ligase [Desulfuromonas acetoxidans]